jgi:uncharacterized protein
MPPRYTPSPAARANNVLKSSHGGRTVPGNNKSRIWRNIMANPFVHVELNTSDIAAAKAFYSALFDWKLTDVPMGPGFTYTMINVGEGVGGGMAQHPVPGEQSGWLAYTMVDDVAAATEKARSLGATIVREKTEVPETGWLSIIMDPTGAKLGLWQPAPRA